MTRTCFHCHETFPAELIRKTRTPHGLEDMCAQCAKDKAITITGETMIWKNRS
jgi:hypothetical protein